MNHHCLRMSICQQCIGVIEHAAHKEIILGKYTKMFTENERDFPCIVAYKVSTPHGTLGNRELSKHNSEDIHEIYRLTG